MAGKVEQNRAGRARAYSRRCSSCRRRAAPRRCPRAVAAPTAAPELVLVVRLHNRRQVAAAREDVVREEIERGRRRSRTWAPLALQALRNKVARPFRLKLCRHVRHLLISPFRISDRVKSSNAPPSDIGEDRDSQDWIVAAGGVAHDRHRPDRLIRPRRSRRACRACRRSCHNAPCRNSAPLDRRSGRFPRLRRNRAETRQARPPEKAIVSPSSMPAGGIAGRQRRGKPTKPAQKRSSRRPVITRPVRMPSPSTDMTRAASAACASPRSIKIGGMLINAPPNVPAMIAMDSHISQKR